MAPFVELIDIVLTFYVWVVVIYVVLSWLVQFDVINSRNQFVRTLGDFLFRLTEPALRPIRRILPNLGGVDLSPMVLILLVWFIRRLMREYLAECRRRAGPLRSFSKRAACASWCGSARNRRGRACSGSGSGPTGAPTSRSRSAPRRKADAPMKS